MLGEDYMKNIKYRKKYYAQLQMHKLLLNKRLPTKQKMHYYYYYYFK